MNSHNAGLATGTLSLAFSAILLADLCKVKRDVKKIECSHDRLTLDELTPLRKKLQAIVDKVNGGDIQESSMRFNISQLQK